MEQFDIGNHVLIELEDVRYGTRRVAGYLVSVADEGFVLKVTHKDQPVTHMISELLAAKIRDDLDAVPLPFLVAELVSRKMYSSLGRKSVMVEALAASEEAEIVARNYESKPLTFAELSVPVLTFVAGGPILLMEDSDDLMEDIEVTEFNRGIDGALEELLGSEVAEKPAE